MMDGERNYRQPVLYAYALLLLLVHPSITVGAEEKKYRCMPEIKYECDAGQCERMTGDFQHAESFSYNPASGEIGACLWTNCYAARATVFPDAAAGGSGTFTVIGRLIPVAHPGNDPIVVSLTIDKENVSGSKGNRSFTAAWNYRSRGLTLDLGQCVLEGHQVE